MASARFSRAWNYFQSTDSSANRAFVSNFKNRYGRVDSANQHLWKSVRIGQINADGQFDIVWEPGTLIPARPFPKSRSASEWEQFLADLYAGWGGNWENQGP